MSLPSNLGLVIPFLISSDQSYIIGYKSEILYYQDSDWHTLALPGAHENTRIHVLKQASRNSIWIGAGKRLFRMTHKQNKPAMMSHGLSCKNYPNPFNPETTFNISLPQDGHASFKIYDILGRETETLLNQSTSAGMHRISWNAARYPSGLYYAVLEFAGQRIVQKVLLQK
jgi:hypothetical protein